LKTAKITKSDITRITLSMCTNFETNTENFREIYNRKLQILTKKICMVKI